jgi:hypothetical protein
MTIMCNQSEIYALRLRNTEFRSVFDANYSFSVKPKAETTLEIF